MYFDFEECTYIAGVLPFPTCAENYEVEFLTLFGDGAGETVVA